MIGLHAFFVFFFVAILPQLVSRLFDKIFFFHIKQWFRSTQKVGMLIVNAKVTAVDV